MQANVSKFILLQIKAAEQTGESGILVNLGLSWHILSVAWTAECLGKNMPPKLQIKIPPLSGPNERSKKIQNMTSSPFMINACPPLLEFVSEVRA